MDSLYVQGIGYSEESSSGPSVSPLNPPIGFPALIASPGLSGRLFSRSLLFPKKFHAEASQGFVVSGESFAINQSTGLAFTPLVLFAIFLDLNRFG